MILNSQAARSYKGSGQAHHSPSPEYFPRKDIPVADAPSRISLCRSEAVHVIHRYLNASPQRVPQIRQETDKPCVGIMHGLPEKRFDCPAYLRAHLSFRDELSVADGLILKGARIVIPGSLQPDVLETTTLCPSGC